MRQHLLSILLQSSRTNVQMARLTGSRYLALSRNRVERSRLEKTNPIPIDGGVSSFPLFIFGNRLLGSYHVSFGVILRGSFPDLFCIKLEKLWKAEAP